MPVALIANPAAGPAGRRGRLPGLIEAAHAAIPDLSVWPTEGPGSAAELARRAADKGFGSVLVAGGDGTINEALEGLVGTDTCLGPLPMGTANVLCRELGLGVRPVEALARLLERGRPRPVCLGHLTGDGVDRHFLLMVGVGLDAAIVDDVRDGLKRRLGVGAYFLQSGLTGIRYRYPDLRVTVDGETHVGTSVVIANARSYAGSFQLAPDAGLAREDLCMVLFDGQGPVPYLGHALSVLMGNHTVSPGVAVLHGDAFRIESDAPLPAQVDGERAGTVPLTVTARPDALRLLAPRGARLE
jgi:YegS/Rv2252/BmrU family lipid kinase